MPITLSLSLSGDLCATIPHEKEGLSSTLILPKGKELQVLYRILHAQQQGIRAVTGSQSCPTQWVISQSQERPQPRRLPTKSRHLSKGQALTLEDLDL